VLLRALQEHRGLGCDADCCACHSLSLFRWASCTPGGTLNFRWRCLMAPLTILDYIEVHELAHLIHANHTQAFWNEVDKVMPDYQERKEWLGLKGAGMDL
jgi:predicted metal-dependent hydrolase